MTQNTRQLNKDEALRLQSGDFVYIETKHTTEVTASKVPAIVMHNDRTTIWFTYYAGGNVTGTTDEKLNEINNTWFVHKDTGASVETPDGTLVAIPVPDETYPAIEIRLVQPGDNNNNGTTLSLTEYTHGGELMDESEFPFPTGSNINSDFHRQTTPMCINTSTHRTKPGFITRTWTNKNAHHDHIRTLHRGYRFTQTVSINSEQLKNRLQSNDPNVTASTDIFFNGSDCRAVVTYSKGKDNSIKLTATLKKDNVKIAERVYEDGLATKTIDIVSDNVHYIINIEML